MKTLALIIVFVLLPLFFVNAQNEKVVKDSKSEKTYTVEWKDISCPDCQGWGWLLGEGFKNNTPVSLSGSGSNQPVRQKGVSNSGMERYRCMDCNGSGKIKVKYYKHTL